MNWKVRILVLLLLAVGAVSPARAQTHFIYLQSDEKLPFTVRLNQKDYSSSASGYLIIPQLKNAEYILRIVPPRDDKAVHFRVLLNGDQGFYLKKDNGAWRLENIQTSVVINSFTPDAAGRYTASGGTRFSEILADVVGEPDLGKQVAAAPAKPKTEAAGKTPVAPAVLKETGKAGTTVQTEEAEAASGDTVDINTSGVIKASQEEKNGGTDVTFLDFNQKTTDTIRIFIPSADSSRIAPAATELREAVTREPAGRDSARVVAEVKHQVPETAVKPVADSSLGRPVAETAVFDPGKEVKAAKDSVNNPFHQPVLKEEPKVDTALAVNAVNTSCTALASNDDFLKLRRRMASQEKEEDMISAARKAFRSKCYTTEQVKNLGALFLSDQSRYAFFDAVYPHVFDVSQFGSLESQLIEDYYKKRFKAMLK